MFYTMNEAGGGKNTFSPMDIRIRLGIAIFSVFSVFVIRKIWKERYNTNKTRENGLIANRNSSQVVENIDGKTDHYDTPAESSETEPGFTPAAASTIDEENVEENIDCNTDLILETETGSRKFVTAVVTTDERVVESKQMQSKTYICGLLSSLVDEYGKATLQEYLNWKLLNTNKLLYEFLCNRNHTHSLYHMYEKRPCCKCSTPKVDCVKGNLYEEQWSCMFQKLPTVCESCTRRKQKNINCLLQYCVNSKVSISDFDITLLKTLLLHFKQNLNIPDDDITQILCINGIRNEVAHGDHFNAHVSYIEEQCKKIILAIKKLAKVCSPEFANKTLEQLKNEERVFSNKIMLQEKFPNKTVATKKNETREIILETNPGEFFDDTQKLTEHFKNAPYNIDDIRARLSNEDVKRDVIDTIDPVPIIKELLTKHHLPDIDRQNWMANKKREELSDDLLNIILSNNGDAIVSDFMEALENSKQGPMHEFIKKNDQWAELRIVLKSKIRLTHPSDFGLIIKMNFENHSELEEELLNNFPNEIYICGNKVCSTKSGSVIIHLTPETPDACEKFTKAYYNGTLRQHIQELLRSAGVFEELIKDRVRIDVNISMDGMDDIDSDETFYDCHWDLLLEEMSPKPVVDLLLRKGLLDNDDVDDILRSKTRFAQSNTLLSKLNSKEIDTLPAFKKCLSDTSQDYILQKIPEIAEVCDIQDQDEEKWKIESAEMCEKQYQDEEKREIDDNVPGSNVKDNTFAVIRNMDGGMEPRFDVRIIVVGHLKAGKTTLIGRLLLKHFKMRDTGNTNGIIIIHNGGIRLKKGEWVTTDNIKDSVQVLRRMKTAKAAGGHRVTNADISEAGLQRAREAADAYFPSYSQYDEGPTCTVHFMDFAGQSVFNSTHQMFMTHRAIYLLVLDISRPLESEVEDDDVYCVGANRRMSVQELTEFLMSSIHVYSGDLPESYPKVLLVGTHKDLVDEETANNRMVRIISQFKRTPLEKHLVDDFIVDCSNENDSEIDILRQSIFQIAEKEPHWGEETPTRWLPLEEKIINKRDKGVRVLTLQVIRDMNGECFAKIQSDDEIERFLRFHNDLGNLMYFGGASQNDLVILDPQWLVDALKQIITHKQFFLTPRRMKAYLKDFNECAKLNKKLVKAVWSENKDKTFITHMEELFIILEQTDIICTPLTYNKDGEAESPGYFFVPTMLKPNKEGTTNVENLIEVSRAKSPPLCFVFRDKFMQPAIFPRLQADCTNIYKIKEVEKQPLIFYQVSVFQLNQELDLVIAHVGHMIKVTIINEYGMNLNPEICENVRLTIEDALRKIVRLYGGSTVPFHTAVQCKDDEDLISWSELETSDRTHREHVLGPWLTFKVQDGEKQRLTRKGNTTSEGGLGFVHLGRLARQLKPEALLLAARTAVTDNVFDHARFDNRDNVVSEVYDVLIKWKEQTGCLTLETIHDALEESQAQIAFELLQEAVADTDMSGYFKEFNPLFLDKRVNDETIDLIAQRSLIFYRFLALELGVDHYEIEYVIRDTDGEIRRTKRLLGKWRRNSRSRATYRAIGQAIREAGMDINLLKDCQRLVMGREGDSGKTCTCS